jgi:hypothetical protein
VASEQSAKTRAERMTGEITAPNAHAAWAPWQAGGSPLK